VIAQQATYPFGESWYTTGTGVPDKFLFTSYERDQESGLDYAMARYYDSSVARFCSADPVLGSPDDPQTWNRYTYVRNDPVNKVDPSGKFFELLFALLDDLLSSLGVLAETLGQAAPTLYQTIEVTATPLIIPSTDIAITTGLAGGAVAGAAGQNSNLFENEVKDSQKQAEKGTQNGQCKTFIENLLAKLNKGIPGVGNSSAASFAKRIAKSTFSISLIPFMGPTGPEPDAIATTPLGSFHPTFYPSAFRSGNDLAEIYTHEAFHMGQQGKTDIDINNALFDTAHKPHLPLTGTPEDQVSQASARWNKELQKNCNFKAGQ